MSAGPAPSQLPSSRAHGQEEFQPPGQGGRLREADVRPALEKGSVSTSPRGGVFEAEAGGSA